MEKKLVEYGNRLSDAEVPEELLDQAIEAGFQRAKLEKKKKPRRFLLLSVALIAIVLVGFSGIGRMIELIKHDKGLVAAIENSYYEEMGVSEKKDGIEFVIDGAIADEMGLILFYTIKTDEKQRNISIEKIDLKGLDGGTVNLGTITFGAFHDEIHNNKSESGVLEFFFQEPLTAKDFQLNIGVEGESIKEAFALTFSLKKEIQTKKVYPLNQAVEIEGQKIIIEEAIVYPLRVAVRMKYDSNNTKVLFEFEDLRLVDENGEVWSKVRSGTWRSGISENEWIYYLQSNYFKEPKELYLAFDKIQAVDKEYREIIVDTQQKKIIKQPPSNKLSDLEISNSSIIMHLYTEEEFPYGLFNEVVDGNGNKIDISSNFISSRLDEGYVKNGVEIQDLNSYQNPLSLKLVFFPEWIVGAERIRIK